MAKITKVNSITKICWNCIESELFPKIGKNIYIREPENTLDARYYQIVVLKRKRSGYERIGRYAIDVISLKVSRIH